MPFTRIVVSWARWTNVPPNLAQNQSDAELEPHREQLDATLERARMNALAHFGKPDEFAKVAASD